MILHHSHSSKKSLLYTLGAVLAAGAVISLVTIFKPPLPMSVTKKATFTLLYPEKSDFLSYERSSVQFDPANNGVSMRVLVNGKLVVLTQQELPDELTNDKVFEYKAHQAREFNEFQTSVGKVALIKPTELSGQPAAMVKAGNTLMFGRSFDTLNTEEWRLLFSHMQRAD